MQWPLPCDRLLKTKLPHWSSILFIAGHARAWSVAWHSWDGRLENNDSAACPPAARRTGTRMSKREVFKCLNINRASGPINVESAMIHCDTISSAAANWKANRWAWACGNDKTHVMTEQGCALDGTQWAGERSPASGSPAAKMCPATEHSTASSEWLYWDPTANIRAATPARATSNWSLWAWTLDHSSTNGREASTMSFSLRKSHMGNVSCGKQPYWRWCCEPVTNPPAGEKWRSHQINANELSEVSEMVGQMVQLLHAQHTFLNSLSQKFWSTVVAYTACSPKERL